MKRFSIPLSVAMLLGSSLGIAAPPTNSTVVVVVVGLDDAERVRAAVGRELNATVIASNDPRAVSASGWLSIDARLATKTLTVTFRKSPDAPPIVRSVALPDDRIRAENSAVILASNVARDEADDVLLAMKKGAELPPPLQKRVPPPSPQQVAALSTLKDGVAAYEKGAKDYRDTVTTIVKLHYEAKKKEVLSGLDREIMVEKAELKKARDTAIQRLEALVTTYATPPRSLSLTGSEAPDAMYRLASLYEERARAGSGSEPARANENRARSDDGGVAPKTLDEGLKDAIRLYKRVIREYPTYRESAGVHYFLGHALNDIGRVSESQQVWRSLVCRNHFAYPTKADSSDPERDIVASLPQDAPEAYWTEWRRRFESPKSVSKKNPETVYQEVYPDDCTPVAQPSLRPGEDPKYVSEVWWQIGNWEFDQLDFASGVTKTEPASVWGFNRAASAYRHALHYKRPPLYGVALYKHAWTLFKQQRYELATKELVKLLVYTDEQEKVTGDHGADFRSEAYTYIAGSLTNADFKGPEDWEPHIARPDPVLDGALFSFARAQPPAAVAKQLHVAIDRVKDAQLIPQDKPWTIEIYRALALELRSLNQFANAHEVYESMLQKWPMDPTAPDTQNVIAETYDQMNITQKPGTPAHDAIAAQALDARTKLARYIGNTPWVDANKDHPAAIQNAERLVRTGLRQAAAQHTNNAKAALLEANLPELRKNQARQLELLARAASEYKLAAGGWDGYLKHEDAADAYESRYWNADARHKYVRTTLKLHEAAPSSYAEPSRKDIDEAIIAATIVRDWNTGKLLGSELDARDKYLDNAAYFVVDLSDVGRDLAYARFVKTKGASGIEKREEVKFDGADPATRNVVKDVIPSVVQESLNAREDFVRIGWQGGEAQKRALEYEYWIAETYFLYGQWDRARPRFEAMWKQHCGTDAFAFKAWTRLVTMAAKQRDEARSLQLADAVDPKKGGRSCDAEGERRYADPIRTEATELKARRKLEEACEAKIGEPCKDSTAPHKKPMWREVAALYESASEAGAQEASGSSGGGNPTATMNAAYAYKQLGAYDKAIALYKKFIAIHGASAPLDVLQKGDPKTKVAPDPKAYAERVKHLADAYDALGATYYALFDYQQAAATYDALADNDRLDEAKRRAAANNAMILYASAGQRNAMLSAHRSLSHLHPTVEEKAEADYRAASFDAKQWDANGPDTGPNRQSRIDGERALIQFFQANRANVGASRFNVEAAYWVAKMQRAGGEADKKTWLANTTAAWDKLKATDAAGAQKKPYVDYAAEAAFTLIDDAIAATFDAPSQRYGVSSIEILGDARAKGKYQLNAADAKAWNQRLETEVIRKYESLEWVVTAIARQGVIFDALRSGLYNTTKVKLFNAEGEKVIRALRSSGHDDRADALEDTAKDVWQTRKQREIDDADEIMIDRYATAIASARKYSVKSALITKAIGRLAFYTDVIGETKMQKYVESTPDPTTKGASKLSYTPKMYVLSRPGLTPILPTSQSDPKPLPAPP